METSVVNIKSFQNFQIVKQINTEGKCAPLKKVFNMLTATYEEFYVVSW